MRVRFTDEDANTGKFLGEGQHEVNITKVTEGKSKAGDDMITVEFTTHNGKSCLDWFVLKFKGKLYSLALAAGATPELLRSGEWDSSALNGKKVMLIRTVTGKRAYQDKEGVTKETDNFENSYVPLSASFTQDTIPF